MKKPADPEKQAQLREALRRDRMLREEGYRMAALRLLPHVCARCGREFSGARLKELTVHHKDHNFRNNPPDGSNWELLCLYCHDAEHEKDRLAGTMAGDDRPKDSIAPRSPIATPFAHLESLFSARGSETGPETPPRAVETEAHCPTGGENPGASGPGDRGA